MDKKESFSDMFGAALAVFCLTAMYVFPEVVKKSTVDALMLCGRSVIPSLFAFIVVTRLVLHFSSGMFERIYAKKKIGSMSVPGYIALILGLISGFPTGAIVSGQMQERGLISKTEAHKVAVFSSAASPAFCINLFGAEIMKSRLCGVFVYLSAVLVNILLLVIHEMILKPADNDSEFTDIVADSHRNSVSQIIYDSCMTVISICAYVTFFMCIGNVVCSVCSFFIPYSAKIGTIVSGVSEMTSGIASLAGAEYSERLLMGAVFIGFGGFSAIIQVSSVCVKYGISCRGILYTRLSSAVLVPIFTFVFVLIYGMGCNMYHILITLSSLCIISTLIAFFIYFLKKNAKKYKKSKVNL